jgi:hypothetical protein
VAHFCSEYQLKQLSWVDFMLKLDADRTPQLIQYLKERRLYVNEEVTVDKQEEV